MWKGALSGIILANIETLDHYQKRRKANSDVVEDILQYVSDIIIGLPWYFRIPLISFTAIIGLLCLMITGHSLKTLSARRRSSFLKNIQRVPFFGMLNKLVRSLAFLRLFDAIPLSVDD